MSERYQNSFDYFSTAQITMEFVQIAATPNLSPVISSGNGHLGTNCIRWSTANIADVGKSVYADCPDASGDTFIMGFWFRHGGAGFTCMAGGTSDDPNQRLVTSGANAETSGILYIREGTITHVWFQLGTDGKIRAYRGSTLLGTTTWSLQQDVASFIEFKVKINNSTGTVEVRKDRIAGMSLTSQDTQNGGTTAWNGFAFGHIAVGSNPSGTVVWDYDAMYALDGSGSIRNDFLGPVRIDYLAPDAVGNSSQWTRSTGANQWATVDETPANGDTDYNSSGVVSDKDTLNFPSVPTSATIFAVRAIVQARKEDAGTTEIKHVTRISSTDYVGAAKSPASSYSFLWHIWEQKPSDTTDWVAADVDAAEFGYQKTA